MIYYITLASPSLPPTHTHPYHIVRAAALYVRLINICSLWLLYSSSRTHHSSRTYRCSHTYFTNSTALYYTVLYCTIVLFYTVLYCTYSSVLIPCTYSLYLLPVLTPLYLLYRTYFLYLHHCTYSTVRAGGAPFKGTFVVDKTGFCTQMCYAGRREKGREGDGHVVER
jgi:hypothetical protein